MNRRTKRFPVFEGIKLSNMTKLLENDLDQASIILAAKGIVNDLQSVIVKLSDISAKNVGSLTDSISSEFSTEEANTFEKSVNQSLQSSINAVKETKEAVNSAIGVLTGEIAPNDMANDTGEDMGTETVDMSDVGNGEEGGDTSDTSENQEAPEPEGRAKKESVQRNKAILESVGRRVLTKESIRSLMAKLFEDASTKMNPVDFKKFSKIVTTQAERNPALMAGWILQNRDSISYSAQTMVPTIAPSARNSNLEITMMESKKKAATDLAQKIEESIQTGKIMESVSTRNAKIFHEMFGLTPAQFHHGLKKLAEAGQAVPTMTTTQTIQPDSSEKPTGSVAPKKPGENDQNALTRLAAKSASNPSIGNNTVDNAINDMSDSDKTEIKKLQTNLEQKGKQVGSVNDLIKSASISEVRGRKKSLISPLAISERKK